jgi:hypothetical protein
MCKVLSFGSNLNMVFTVDAMKRIGPMLPIYILAAKTSNAR